MQVSVCPFESAFNLSFLLPSDSEHFQLYMSSLLLVLVLNFAQTEPNILRLVPLFSIPHLEWCLISDKNLNKALTGRDVGHTLVLTERAPVKILHSTFESHL